MPFRDEYTNFNFDNQDSSAFKVWVTNNRDIKIALTPDFSDSFISPQFGGVRYLNGTTVNKTDITVNCIAINVNMNEWRAICNWLAPNKIGKLNFDFNKNSYYNVKLSKGVSSSSFYNMGVHDKFNGDYRIIEFTLEFTTVGDYAAIGNTNWANLWDVWVIDTETLEKQSWKSWLEERSGVDCLGKSVTELPGTSGVGENCYVRLSGSNTIYHKDNNSELGWIEVANTTWEEDNYNYFNNFYFKNYMLEPTFLSSGDYAGNLTIDLRSLSGNPTDIYNFNYNKEEDENGFIISLVVKKDGEEYKYGYNSEVWMEFDGLFTVPSGFYLVSAGPLPVMPSCHIFNLGEYNEYPTIKLNNITTGFEIYFNNELFYRYEFNTNTPKNNILIDTKTSFLEYRGKLLEMARDYNGAPLLKKSYNNGIPILPSGNPELHLAKVIKNGDGVVKLLLDFPLINNYSVERLGIGMFTGRSNNILYGSSVYEGSAEAGAEYPYSLDNYSSAINCSIEEANGRQVTIRLGQKKGGFNYNVGDKVYISLCEANIMRIVDLFDPLGGMGSIGGTYASASRGAI